MLIHLHIRDFALVHRLDLEFASGMTVLTGETGAGKSILLDALGLALGDRAASDSVRTGAERAEISVAFDITGLPRVGEWLRGQALDQDGDCLLRRVVQANGRSRGFVNGTPVPLQLLRELGEQLVDIHGQHEHQSLMRREIQRGIVDGFGAVGELLAQVRERHEELRALDARMAELRGGHEDSGERCDLLRYQLQELDALDLAPDAIATLEADHRRLTSAGELLQTSQSLLQLLYDDEDSAQSRLGQAQRSLERLTELDPAFAETGELVAGALVQLEEGVDTLRRQADGTDLDPGRLAEVEQQIGTLTDLARKHRCRPEELEEVRERLREELDHLEHAGEHLEELAAKRQACLRGYRELAATLREQRQAAAETLGREVTAQLAGLGMDGAAFRVRLDTLDQESTPHGLDQVSFEVRTNPGQDFGALSRIASGGELSRIGLAIQVVAADSTDIPSLIFDEADSGIGGGVAEVVGRQLRRLGESHQVLCVTHLPQVAAQANHHLVVSKHADDGETRSRVRGLDRDERVREIARMLGGVEITETTLEHAGEMIGRAGTA